MTLEVPDDRSDKIIGYRSYEGASARITSDEDLARVFRETVSEGLTHLGFRVVPSAGDGVRQLRLSIRELRSWYLHDRVYAKAMLNYEASYGGGRLRRDLGAEIDEMTLIIPTAAGNQNRINDVLSRSVDAVLQDKDLLSYLVSPSGFANKESVK